MFPATWILSPRRTKEAQVPKKSMAGNRRTILQVYPESFEHGLRGIQRRTEYLEYMRFGALLSTPTLKWHGKDRGYSPLVDPRQNPIAQVSEEFGTNEDLIALNGTLDEAGITPIGDVVVNHASEASPVVQAFLRGERWAQDWFRLITDEAHRQTFTNKVNIFGEASVRPIPELGEHVYRSATFYADQWEYDALSRKVRRYLANLIRYMYNELGYRGFRLDAIAYAGTKYLQTETGTHEPTGLDLAHFIRGVLDKLPGAFSIAEAGGNRQLVTQWMVGKRCHMAYDFGYPPAMLVALLRGNWRPLINYLASWWWVDPDALWVLFLRVHDELQLRYADPEHRAELIAAYGGDGEFVVFDGNGINQRLSQLVPSRKAIGTALAVTICLDGIPLLFQGDAEGREGDILARRLDVRDPVRDPMSWTSQAPLYGWEEAPPRPFAPDAMSNSVEAQRMNAMSLQRYVRRFNLLRDIEPETMQYGGRLDLPSTDDAAWAFSRLMVGKKEPGVGDITIISNAKSGERVSGRVPYFPYHGKGQRLIRARMDGRAYLGNDQDLNNGIKWEDAGWVTSHEASESGFEFYLEPGEVQVIKCVKDDD
jgi:glycosidase